MAQAQPSSFPSKRVYRAVTSCAIRPRALPRLQVMTTTTATEHATTTTAEHASAAAEHGTTTTA